MIAKSWFLFKNLTLFLVRLFSRLLVHFTSFKAGEALELFKKDSPESDDEGYADEDKSFLALSSFR